MVKMVLSSSDAQGQTMSSVGKARVDAYNSAVKALSNFNGASDLQGSAYDSGKQYGVSVITPLIKGAIMYSEYLSEAVPKLPSKYRSEVGDEDLDSAVLESEIQNLESSISSLRGSLHAMEGSDHADKGLLQNISSRMDGLTSQKNEKMDKLRKLNLFAGSSNEVFEGDAKKSMDTVVKNLASGLNMIQGDFASFGGTFPKHSGKTLNWANSIEGEWDKKAKIDEDYQKVLEKIKDGKELNDDDVKKIDAYKKRFSNRDIPETVQLAVDKHKQAIEGKKLKAAAKEVSEKEGVPYEEALELVGSTVAEELTSSQLEKIKVYYPKLAEYIQYFAKTDKMGNVHISMNSNVKGYTNNVVKETTKSFLKRLASEVDIPVPGTNSSVGISAVSSAFIGYDYYNNLQNENAGRAFMHTAATTTSTAVGVDMLTTGILYTSTGGSMFTPAAMELVGFMGSHPVGWAIMAGIGIGYLATVAYDNNFLGIKDIANDFGDNLNKGLEWVGDNIHSGLKKTGEFIDSTLDGVGKTFDSGIKSIQHVFGF